MKQTSKIILHKNGKKYLTFDIDMEKAKQLPAQILAGEVEFKGDMIDQKSFKRNRTFIEFYINYKNQIALTNPELIQVAKQIGNGRLPALDREAREHPEKEPKLCDIIGFYIIKEGKPVMFAYNIQHEIIRADGAISLIFQEQPLLDIVQEIVEGSDKWKKLLEPVPLEAARIKKTRK